MNWKAISLGAGGLLFMAISGLAAVVNQNYSQSANSKAESFRTEDEIAELKEAEEIMELAKNVRARESKELGDKLREWDVKNNYKETVREINKTANEAIEAFKESINYDARKEEIELAAENAIEEFKDSIDYDDKIRDLNGDVRTANEIYEKRCRLYNLADSDDEDISDTVKDLKKIEKDKRDSAVKEAKDRAKELREQLDKEKSDITRKMNSELRDLDKELLQTKNSVEKTRTEQLSVIDRKRDAYKANILDGLSKSRTDAEVHALEENTKSWNRVKDQEAIDAQRAIDFYKNAEAYEKWAAYFRDKNVPKWVVATVGTLPLIPVAWGTWSYIRFLYMTVKTI